MFGSRLSLKSLAFACRSLGTLLHSGVAIKDAFRLTADKSVDPRLRRALSEVVNAISAGQDVASAMREQGEVFPDLVIDMVRVAEESGSLPEILVGLAEHYENNLRLRRAFFTAILWPAIQLVAAILIVALLIMVLGWIAESRGGEPIDILGLGLSGEKGAVIWLLCTFGPILGLIVAYQILSSTLAGKRFLDPLLMKIPLVGGCMRSFAIARFSWAFYLTQQTGMPIERSLDASLRATANGAFIEASRVIRDRVRSGERLTDALAASGLFPEEFLHMVDVAETSGTVPEALHRLSPQFEEQARRRLAALTVALGWLIWLMVAIFIIVLIFNVVIRAYIGPIYRTLEETGA